MKNPNSLAQRIKRFLSVRWSGEDYPGADPRFHAALLAKDIAIFLLLPVLAVFFYSFLTQPKAASAAKTQNYVEANRNRYEGNASKSQIIIFSGGSSARNSISKRSPGTIVRLRLQNVVETYTTAPVHAQIVGVGLGSEMRGGVMIGDATPDTNFERVSISFRYAKDPRRENTAFSVSARALSLDGTLGLVASKKEAFFTRSAIGSASSASQAAQGKLGGSGDFGQILIRALTAGLAQEFGQETQVERNRSQVLVLPPGTEFFAELTDFFPGASR